MDRFKIWLIRKRVWIYSVLVVVLILTFYSFFKPEECSYDFWAIVSEITKSISDSEIPSKWNHASLTAIFILVPILFVYAISVLIFPVQPWNILSLIGGKKKNTAKLCYSLLKTQLTELTQKIRDLNIGVIVTQNEANEIQERVLPIVSNKNWFATSLLEPDELWKDVNHKNSLENTVYNAKARNIKLIRFIITNKFEASKKDVNKSGSAINEIAKLHKRNEHLLYLVDGVKFKTCFGASGVEKEYLDFLLVDGEVVIGLKNKVINNNGTSIYETITENENYYLFVKDSPLEIEKYKKLVDKLLQNGNHDNSPNLVILTNPQ